MIKVYAIYNTDEAILNLKIGKVVVKCWFKNGVVDGTNDHPATLSTSNPIAQLAIEKSNIFNSRIFLIKTIGTERTPASKPGKRMANQGGKKPAIVKPEYLEEDEGIATSEPSLKEYPGIVNVGDAMNILKSDYAVPVSKMKDINSFLDMAKEVGVAFPDLKI